jgi:hypothetical protein
MSYHAKKKPAPFKDIKERQDAYKQVFAQGLGALVLEDLLNEAAISRTAFAQTQEQTNYNLGKQHIGYHILNLLQLDLKEGLYND